MAQWICEDRAVSKDETFEHCVILSKDTFDPDAVFLDDIVDDVVLPYQNLAVDGLTPASENRKGQLELRPEDAVGATTIEPDTRLPDASLGPEQLDVYGWESSLWKKIRSYLGF